MNNNNNTQPWMLPTDGGGPDTYNYMLSRPPGSVLPIPPQHSHSHQHQHQHQHQQQQQPQPHMSMQHSSMHRQEQSLSPPAQAHEHEHSKNNKGSRAVIPSKRAAQNRAAQKAFRQRREQYIKDLETKAKEMEEWQEEMDKLRKENGDLRERVATLENQVAVLTGGDATKIAELEKLKPKPEPSSFLTSPSASEPAVANRRSPERSMSLPITKTNDNEEWTRRGSASPTIITSSSVKRSHNESRLRHEQTEEDNNSTVQQQEGSFVPVPLRAPHQTGFETPSYHPNDHPTTLIGNDNTNTTSPVDDTKRRKLDNIGIDQSSPLTSTPISTANSTPIFQNNANVPVDPIMHNSSNAILIPNEQPPTSNHFWGNSVGVGNDISEMPTTSSAAAAAAAATTTTASVSGSAPPPPPPPPLPPAAMGDFDLDFDFDPFFEDEFGPTITNNNDFLPNANSGQVLDDLFAMLQTRQRPQIPMVPSEENSESAHNNNNNNNQFNDSLGRL